MENNEQTAVLATLQGAETTPPEIEKLQSLLQNQINTLNEIRSAAEASLKAIVESQKNVADTSEAAKEVLVEIKSIAKEALASKTAVFDAQTVIATKSDHIEDARKHADDVRAEMDRVLTAATQQATEAEGLKTRAQSATDTASSLLTSIQTSKELADTDVAAIKTASESAKSSSAVLKGLSDKATTVEQSISSYEIHLASLSDQCAGQLKTITDLLPGATSAGLAHAFDDRRKTFLGPAEKWQWLFVGSLVSLVALAFTGMYHVYQDTRVLSYDELGRLWLARLPVAGALIWLALHASREAALAKRLEEDYGYKAVISASFLGFNKQMQELGDAANTSSPLAQLCDDTLATISSPPGRIYDKHALTVSPSGELKETAKAILPQADKG